MYDIGERIRTLRRQKQMTQERLAQLLGVSAQSVSKWENRLTAPDIALLPAIASVFGVSIDRLFGYDQRKTEEETADLCRRAQACLETDRAKSREMLREGLRRFPGHPALLGGYLHTLDRAADGEEILRIASDLAENAPEEGLRLEALAFLAEIYAGRGEYAAARAAIARVPEVYFTRHSLAAMYLQGEEKRRAAEAQKELSVELLVDMLRELAAFFQAEGRPDRARRERERAGALIDLFADGERSWVEALRREVEQTHGNQFFV